MKRPPSIPAAALAVAWKELTTSLRDRQTVIYTLVLPIALYPCVFWLMIQGALFVQGREERTEVRLGLAAVSGEIPPDLAPALAEPAGPERWPAAASELGIERAAVEKVEVALHDGPLDRDGARAWLAEPAQRAESTQPAEFTHPGGSAPPDAVLLLGAGEAGGSVLLFDSTRPGARIARDRALDRLPRLASDLRRRAALESGLELPDLEPFLRDPDRDLAPVGDRITYLLSFLLPALLVVMTVMGAFFPAVDLTAGERERGTAETTLVLPVPRVAVLQGKILAVSAAAIVATALNLFAMGLSAGPLLGMLEPSAALAGRLPLSAFLAALPLTLLFALCVSAVLTAVAACARTFKEGQALLGPVQMVFLFPALAGSMPGLELDPVLALVPVVDVVLAFRALLLGQIEPLEYALTALTLLALAALSLWAALRVLSRESLIASDRTIALRDLVALWRSPGGTR